MANAEEIRAKLDSGWENVKAAPLDNIRERLVEVGSSESLRVMLGNLATSVVAAQTERGEITTLAEQASEAIHDGAAKIIPTLDGSENANANVARSSATVLQADAEALPVIIQRIGREGRNNSIDNIFTHISAIYQILDQTDEKTQTSVQKVDEILVGRNILGISLEEYKKEAL